MISNWVLFALFVDVCVMELGGQIDSFSCLLVLTIWIRT